MKIGCFGTADQLALIENAGFDSAELDFCELVNMDETEYSSFLDKAKHSPVNFEVFSGLIPLSQRFHSPEFNLDYWLDKIDKGAKRAQELGCIMIPFGAGKCRSIPENVDINTATRTVAKIVRSISELLQQYQIQLVIEPLGPANSNFLNTLPEVEEFLKIVDHPNCSSMVDLRHMHKTSEPLTNIEKYLSIVKHAHIDYPRALTRYFPSPEDDFDYDPYIRTLLAVNYNGLLTIEATAVKNDFFSEASKALTYLRTIISKYE